MSGVTMILADWPLTAIELEACVTCSQGGPPETLVEMLSGQPQLPVAVIWTVWGPGFWPPWTALKTRALDEACARVQGGRTSTLTVIVCGLPLAVLLDASLPLRVIWPT